MDTSSHSSLSVWRKHSSNYYNVIIEIFSSSCLCSFHHRRVRCAGNGPRRERGKGCWINKFICHFNCFVMFFFLMVSLIVFVFLQNHFIVFLQNKPVLNEVDAVETHLSVLMSVKKRWVDSNGKWFSFIYIFSAYG